MTSSTFNIETDYIESRSLNQRADDADSGIDAAVVSERQTLTERLSDIASLSQILRFFGACAVIASMSLFMLKGWSEGNDITRYLKLLGQTGLLTAAGLALSFLIKEYKGARVFFGLSLASVVANFTILGALTYSITQWDGHLMNYPSMMKWVVVDASSFFITFAGASVLLAIVTRFSFSIFARHIAAPLTISFLLLCSLLLIPVRSSIAVCLLVGVSLWAAAFVVKRLSQREKVVMTLETKAALSLLFAPGCIMLLRALSLYNVDAVMLTGLCTLAYIALRSVIKRFESVTFSTRMVEITQAAVSLVLSYQLVLLLPSMNEALQAGILVVLISALQFDQLKQSNDEGWKSWLLNLTAFGLVFTFLWIAVFDSAVEWKVLSLMVAAITLLQAWFAADKSNNQQIARISAITGLIISALLLGADFVALINLSNWMLIGLGGIALIVGASLYERYGLALRSGERG